MFCLCLSLIFDYCNKSRAVESRHVHDKFLEVETETEIGIENFMANETGYGLGLDIF